MSSHLFPCDGGGGVLLDAKDTADLQQSCDLGITLRFLVRPAMN
jgi:hypothetical protein